MKTGCLKVSHEKNFFRTMCVSCTDATVEVETAILQDAVVLDPRVLDLVHFVEQTQTLGVFHRQRRQIGVVSGDVHPHMVLQRSITDLNTSP